jgi:hypothetical protein
MLCERQRARSKRVMGASTPSGHRVACLSATTQEDFADMEGFDIHAPGRPGPAVVARRDGAISTEAGDAERP